MAISDFYYITYTLKIYIFEAPDIDNVKHVQGVSKAENRLIKLNEYTFKKLTISTLELLNELS